MIYTEYLRNIVVNGRKEAVSQYENELGDAERRRKELAAQQNENRQNIRNELRLITEKLSNSKEIREKVELNKQKLALKKQLKEIPEDTSIFMSLSSEVRGYAVTKEYLSSVVYKDFFVDNHFKFNKDDKGFIVFDERKIDSQSEEKLRHIADFVLDYCRTYPEKIKSSKGFSSIFPAISIDQAMHFADSYYQQKSEREKSSMDAKKKMEESKKGLKLLANLGDGVYAAEMLTEEALKYEGTEMGICIGGENYVSRLKEQGTHFYTIRNLDGTSYATIERVGNELKQIKGKANKTIPARYVNYARKFIDDLQKKEKIDFVIPVSENKNLGFYQDKYAEKIDIYDLKNRNAPAEFTLLEISDLNIDAIDFEKIKADKLILQNLTRTPKTEKLSFKVFPEVYQDMVPNSETPFTEIYIHQDVTEVKCKKICLTGDCQIDLSNHSRLKTIDFESMQTKAYNADEKYYNLHETEEEQAKRANILPIILPQNVEKLTCPESGIGVFDVQSLKNAKKLKKVVAYRFDPITDIDKIPENVEDLFFNFGCKTTTESRNSTNFKHFKKLKKLHIINCSNNIAIPDGVDLRIESTNINNFDTPIINIQGSPSNLSCDNVNINIEAQDLSKLKTMKVNNTNLLNGDLSTADKLEEFIIDNGYNSNKERQNILLPKNLKKVELKNCNDRLVFPKNNMLKILINKEEKNGISIWDKDLRDCEFPQLEELLLKESKNLDFSKYNNLKKLRLDIDDFDNKSGELRLPSGISNLDLHINKDPEQESPLDLSCYENLKELLISGIYVGRSVPIFLVPENLQQLNLRYAEDLFNLRCDGDLSLAELNFTREWNLNFKMPKDKLYKGVKKISFTTPENFKQDDVLDFSACINLQEFELKPDNISGRVILSDNFPLEAGKELKERGVDVYTPDGYKKFLKEQKAKEAAEKYAVNEVVLETLPGDQYLQSISTTDQAKIQGELKAEGVPMPKVDQPEGEIDVSSILHYSSGGRPAKTSIEELIDDESVWNNLMKIVNKKDR